MVSRQRPAHPSTSFTPRRRRLTSRARALGASWRSTRSAAQQRSGDESGAVIILALVFLVAVSLIVTALLTWTGASLHATTNFQDERNVEYAATDAVNLAIQNTRYSFDYGTSTSNPYSPSGPMLNNATPQLCATYQVPGQTNSVDVYCTLVWQPYSANTRVFTYSACSTAGSNNAKPADCAAQPLLQAVVAFDDYPSGVASPSPIPSQCTPILQQGNPPSGPDNGSCGVSMTQLSWLWNPVVPAITSLSPSAGATSGGTTVTIQGRGFTSGETVNFLEQPQELATGAYNAPVAATISAPSPSCPLSTCIQVASPAITIGRAYFVTVTTPSGTSQTAPNDYTSSFVPTFTYSPVAPTVTGLSGTTAGSITGNTLVTIQGTGFWNAPNNTFPAQAFFCPTGGGAPVSSAKCSGGLAGSVVNIFPPASGSTTFTMTALSPALPQGSTAGTYYLQVEVFNVYSVQTSAVFTYTVQAPLVVSLNPLSGATGTSVTISGANFLTNSTVGFCAETNGNPTNANCPTNTSLQTMATVVSLTATQIIISIPTMAAGTYYPIVTLPSAYNSTPPSQPYNEPSDIFTHT